MWKRRKRPLWKRRARRRKRRRARSGKPTGRRRPRRPRSWARARSIWMPPGRWPAGGAGRGHHSARHLLAGPGHALSFRRPQGSVPGFGLCGSGGRGAGRAQRPGEIHVPSSGRHGDARLGHCLQRVPPGGRGGTAHGGSGGIRRSSAQTAQTAAQRAEKAASGAEIARNVARNAAQEATEQADRATRRQSTRAHTATRP